jgi:AmmeMemoRadiSam system protein B
MKRHYLHRILVFTAFVLWGQVYLTNISLAQAGIRKPVDTVGFATFSWQMDSVMTRISREQGKLLQKTLADAHIADDYTWKTVICPHDDYTYVGYLYPAVLKNLKAKTIILFGVAHKARQLDLENQIIFDSYASWKEPKGNVPVSTLREEIIKELPPDIYQVNDSMQSIEHSIEALVPFLQYYHPDVEIVPILVPYMNYERADEIAHALAAAIQKVTQKRNWTWGEDYAIAISSDAVHYGDQDWGGSNYAFFGADTSGYIAAVQHEWEIINTISSGFTPEYVRKFTTLTIDENDCKKYKWTWCGRYSIPMGLLTSYYLAGLLNHGNLRGVPVGYATSIDHKPIKVDDIRMGVTAPANIHHWVGYAAIGYK